MSRGQSGGLLQTNRRVGRVIGPGKRLERKGQQQISGILVILMAGLVRRRKIAFVSVVQRLDGAQV